MRFKPSLIVATLMALIVPSALLSTGPSASAGEQQLPRFVKVEDPIGNVDRAQGVGGWWRSVDVEWVTYRTYWEDGVQMLRVRTKIRNATRRDEPEQVVEHTLDARSGANGPFGVDRAITVVHHTPTTANRRPLAWSTPPGGGIKLERSRYWVNTKTNIIGMEMSTESFGPNTMVSGRVLVATKSREGRYPRNETPFSPPVRL